VSANMYRVTTAPVPAAQLFAEAHFLLTSGRVEQAEAIYKQLLKLRPRHLETLRQLGICRLRRGDYAGAIKRFDEALKIDPRSPVEHAFRGHALWGMGRLPEALRNYERAIALDRRLFDAHFHRAAALEQMGRPGDALAAYDEALALEPQHARTHSGRANVLAAMGRCDEAIAGYLRARALEPNLADAHANLGATLLYLNRFEEALAAIEQALGLQPAHPGALATRPRALEALGRDQDALAALDMVLSRHADDAESWQLRGRILVRMQRATDALPCFDRALALAPSHRDAAFGRGLAFAQLGRPEEVLEIFDGLLREQADDALALVNRGYAQIQLGDFDEGRESIERGLALKPDQPRARFQLALLDLTQGNFEKGFEGYEWRWLDPQSDLRPPVLPVPRWSGSDSLAGRTILIHAEQGLGDTIQFSRFIPVLASAAARVVYAVPAPLCALLRRCLPGPIETIIPGDAFSAVDLHCPLLSLPLALGTTLATLPAPQHYLWPDPERRAAWQQRLGAGPMIGLVWSGSPTHANDRNRSISLSRLAPLLATGRRFVALQEQVRPSDLAAANSMPGLDLVGDDFEDFEDTAAAASLCDLVITVDTSVAHLAGAMGKPVWLLLPFVPDWRWLLDRTDSPWYPSMRIFRQSKRGDWDGVIARVVAALHSHAPPD